MVRSLWKLPGKAALKGYLFEVLSYTGPSLSEGQTVPSRSRQTMGISLWVCVQDMRSLLSVSGSGITILACKSTWVEMLSFQGLEDTNKSLVVCFTKLNKPTSWIYANFWFYFQQTFAEFWPEKFDFDLCKGFFEKKSSLNFLDCRKKFQSKFSQQIPIGRQEYTRILSFFHFHIQVLAIFL
jgi:hypothetical protein